MFEEIVTHKEGSGKGGMDLEKRRAEVEVKVREKCSALEEGKIEVMTLGETRVKKMRKMQSKNGHFSKYARKKLEKKDVENVFIFHGEIFIGVLRIKLAHFWDGIQIG